MVRSSLFYLLDKILVPLVDLHILVDTLDIFVEDKKKSKMVFKANNPTIYIIKPERLIVPYTMKGLKGF